MEWDTGRGSKTRTGVRKEDLTLPPTKLEGKDLSSPALNENDHQHNRRNTHALKWSLFFIVQTLLDVVSILTFKKIAAHPLQSVFANPNEKRIAFIDSDSSQETIDIEIPSVIALTSHARSILRPRAIFPSTERQNS